MGHAEYRKLVKLDQAQRDALMTRLSHPNSLGSQVKPRTGSNRRRDLRWNYRHSDMALLVEHPGGGVSRLLVCARNLSAGGISFLHGGFLHPGSRCKLSLKQTDGGTTVHTGKIVSCRHLERTLHEVGLQFDKRVDPAQFVQSTEAPMDESSLTLSPLNGSVLYVDSSTADQDLMRFYLEGCGAHVVVANTGEAASALVTETSFIAIITELSLPDIAGAALVQSLRQSGASMPIIAVTADERADLQREATAAGCNSILIKPLDFASFTTLLRRLVPAQPTSQGIEPVYSTQWDDQKMRPLIETFLHTLEREVQHLSVSIAEGNVEALRKTCLMLKGAAGGYGYPQISQAAQAIIKLLDQSTSIDGIQSSVDALVGTCTAACMLKPQSTATSGPSTEAAA